VNRHVALGRKVAQADHASRTMWRYRAIRWGYDVAMTLHSKPSGLWDFTNAYWQRVRELNGEVSA
jgi:hypothetical protein